MPDYLITHYHIFFKNINHQKIFHDAERDGLFSLIGRILKICMIQLPQLIYGKLKRKPTDEMTCRLLPLGLCFFSLLQSDDTMGGSIPIFLFLSSL